MEKYIPDIYQKSIYTINYAKLFRKGITCLLFDLDNTIVASNSNELPVKAKDLFVSLKQKGFMVVLFSNSPRGRVNKFKKLLKVEGISLACKPLLGKFNKLIKKYDLNKGEIAIIGDQLLTDVALGKKAGITTVLVNQVSTKDHVFSKVNRMIERKKIKEMEECNLFERGRYYD